MAENKSIVAPAKGTVPVPACYADRAAAHAYMQASNGWSQTYMSIVMEGGADDGATVQAFARERIKHEALCEAGQKILTAKLERANNLLFEARALALNDTRIGIDDWLHRSADHLQIPRT